MSNPTLESALPVLSTHAQAQPAAALAPTARAERVPTLDILRGFALFGILLVNLGLFFSSYYAYILGHTPENALDLWSVRFIQFFAEGKFYSIFAFLFGAGIAIFMQRAQAKGVPFVRVYSRRLLVLLGFGIIHALLIWTGDILILYSLLGFIVIFLFRKMKPRRLLIWAAVCLAVPVLINVLSGAAMMMGRAAIGEAAMAETMNAGTAMYAEMQAQADLAYSGGSWLEATRFRMREMSTVLTLLPFMGFNVLAMMLAGFAAAKAGVHTRLHELRPQLRKVMYWGLAIGLLGNALYVYFAIGASRANITLPTVISTTGQTLGAPALALFYMAAITLLTLDPPWRQRAAPVAAAGRMAITNYLAQSLIMSTIAYGYGFGLYGLRPAWFLPIALVTWLIQLAWSSWWLRRFQYGPVEWFWRLLTYGRAEPLRVARTA